MSQNLSKDVEGLLNLPKANQDQIFKQFAKFEKPERISVMEKHQKMLYRLKNLHLPYPIHEISYVALIFAIVQYQDEQKRSPIKITTDYHLKKLENSPRMKQKFIRQNMKDHPQKHKI